MSIKRYLALAAFGCLFAFPLVSSPPIEAQEPETAFGGILRHYENIRASLASDSLDGVHAEAEKIHRILADTGPDTSATRLGVEPDKLKEARLLLPDLGAAAADLLVAETLESSRDAFYELSKLLVRLRKTASGDLPVVAYCSMARRSWLQAEGTLGNPYYGQKMPVCGEVVDP